MKPSRLSLLMGLPILLQAQSHADELAWPNTSLKVQPVIPMKVHAFLLENVRLLDGPFKHAMELDKAYLLSLDVDRLLHNFRINAGLSSKAQPLGGWEAPDCELRGHFVGHFLSACALMYASTGDAHFKTKGDEIVAGLAECQGKIGTGYLSAYPETFIDRVEKRVPVWAPYYTLHKIFAGLEDMYVYCANQQALEIAGKFADWTLARNARLSDEQMQAMLQTEHGGMNETLANLYALTGEEKYLKLALSFNHQRVIGPASQREDKLTGLHANTQIPKFIGTAREYELTGESALQNASLFFWNTVVKERSYVIGGHSDGEMFSAKEQLSQALGPNTTETCNTYNMLKLTRHLFGWDPQGQYADYYERALYNHILASQNPQTGMMCYYVPLRSGSRRNFNGPNDSFWCCTGTGVENHAKYADSIYFHNDRELYVNLFIASELDWKAKGLKLRQETKYPDQSSSRLLFACEKPVPISLHLRRPSWAASGFVVRLNGKEQDLSCQPGQYAVLDRSWQRGDTVEVSVPFTLRIESFKDNPDRFALLNGPLVLAAAVQPRKPFPGIVADDKTLLASLKPVADQPNTFHSSSDVFRVPGLAGGAEIRLEPFYKIFDRNYVVYWDRFSPEQWKVKELAYQAEQAQRSQLEARTVDVVLAGEEQDERDHNFQGERTDTGTADDRLFRFAYTNGWFSWDLKILPGQFQELSVALSGRGRGEGTLDIFAEDLKIATERLPGESKETAPAWKAYPLSPELLKNKEKIRVKFQPPADARGLRVYEVRVLKKGD